MVLKKESNGKLALFRGECSLFRGDSPLKFRFHLDLVVLDKKGYPRRHTKVIKR